MLAQLGAQFYQNFRAFFFLKRQLIQYCEIGSLSGVLVQLGFAQVAMLFARI
ncbi:hypothetical protein D9M69_419850 [compost metagenome]